MSVEIIFFSRLPLFVPSGLIVLGFRQQIIELEFTACCTCLPQTQGTLAHWLERAHGQRCVAAAASPTAPALPGNSQIGDALELDE